MAEVAEGRPWRAREILQGAIRTHATDPTVLERYGRLLDALGDRVQAGNYLFLSGVRGPDVDEAIALFLRRHGRGHREDLLAQFPRSIRKAGIEVLPPVVAEEIEALGLSTSERDPFDAFDEPTAMDRAVAAAALGGCWVLGLVAVALMIVGAITVLRWLL